MRLIAKNLVVAFAEFFEITVILTFVAIFLYFAVGQLLEVTGDSMYPTLKDKEQLIAEKLSIKYRDLKRGDIVIVEHPTEQGILIIKRVVGLPGDTFEIKNGAVWINGQELREPYLPKDMRTQGGQTLKEGESYTLDLDNYILLGDNRTKSTDARYWGIVEKQRIIAKALLVYYPVNAIRLAWH